MDPSTARTALERRLADLDSATATLEGEGAGESSELSHITQHPGDVGTDVADNDREIALLEAGAGTRAEVVAALQRIQDGTYGTCVDCGKPIPDARLEERPEATRCVEDQAKAEARG